jgi:hypothetical protein
MTAVKTEVVMEIPARARRYVSRRNAFSILMADNRIYQTQQSQKTRVKITGWKNAIVLVKE